MSPIPAQAPRGGARDGARRRRRARAAVGGGAAVAAPARAPRVGGAARERRQVVTPLLQTPPHAHTLKLSPLLSLCLRAFSHPSLRHVLLPPLPLVPDGRLRALIRDPEPQMRRAALGLLGKMPVATISRLTTLVEARLRDESHLVMIPPAPSLLHPCAPSHTPAIPSPPLSPRAYPRFRRLVASSPRRIIASSHQVVASYRRRRRCGARRSTCWRASGRPRRRRCRPTPPPRSPRSPTPRPTCARRR